MASSGDDGFVFDLDNEEDAAMEDASDVSRLSWRDNPNDNHSDWSIVISSDGGNTVTYHVHKCVLSVGPRRSLYFENVFSTGLNVSEQQDSTSRITLQPKDAEVFPTMLDYMYSSGDFVINRDNVVALRSLARYFQCKDLVKRANCFIEASLDFESGLVYLRLAEECNDDGLKEICRKFVCFRLNRMSEVDNTPFDLLADLPKDLFCFVMWSPEIHTQSSIASRAVVSFFEHHPNELNAQLLCDLMYNESDEPIKIAPSAAQGIRELVTQLYSRQQDGKIASKLQSLHDACVSVLATKWQNIDEQKCMENILGPSVEGHHFGSRESDAALLCAVLKQAKQDYKILLEKSNKVKETAESVHVSGAGLAAVNGCYTRTGTYEGVGKYTKSGSWNGEGHVFFLFCCTLRSTRKRWFISIVPVGWILGKDSDIDFYSAPMSESNPDYPPSQGWETKEEGVLPPPRITVQFPNISI